MSRTCKDCALYRTNGGGCSPKQIAWKEDCTGFRPLTFFNKITDSCEDLAHYLVYTPSAYVWCSSVVPGAWETYEEAFAATVAKLKEVAE